MDNECLATPSAPKHGVPPVGTSAKCPWPTNLLLPEPDLLRPLPKA